MLFVLNEKLAVYRGLVITSLAQSLWPLNVTSDSIIPHTPNVLLLASALIGILFIQAIQNAMEKRVTC